MKNKAKKKRDIYQDVTNDIIACLEKGNKPWIKPWNNNQILDREYRHNLEPYKGINQLLLWMYSSAKGFNSNYWFSYKQAEAMGNPVKRGEKGSQVIFYKKLSFEDKAEDENGNILIGDTKEVHMIKTYCVFNGDQLQNELKDKYIQKDTDNLIEEKRIAKAEDFYSSIGAKIKADNKAAYYPLSDDIGMPPFEAFKTPEYYYSVLAHEVTHWTGHKSRLDRKKFSTKGSKDYAYEELIAELGSAFLNATIGIKNGDKNDMIDNHASYIKSWLKALKDDKKFIFRAAKEAEKASQFVLNLNATQLKKVA